MIQASERLIENNDGYTLVFLIILFLFVLAKSFFGKHLIFFNSFLFSNSHLLKDAKETKFGLRVIMLLIASLTFGLLLFVINRVYIFIPSKDPVVFFLVLFGIVFVYLLVSNFAGKMLSSLLGIKNVAGDYLFFKVSYLRTIVLFLLPLLLLVVYSSSHQILLLKITLGCTLVLLVLRTSLVLLNNKNLILNELFYFILYICTLEIAPLIIILRLTI